MSPSLGVQGIRSVLSRLALHLSSPPWMVPSPPPPALSACRLFPWRKVSSRRKGGGPALTGGPSGGT